MNVRGVIVILFLSLGCGDDSEQEANSGVSAPVKHCTDNCNYMCESSFPSNETERVACVAACIKACLEKINETNH